jgi:hypothetical protein
MTALQVAVSLLTRPTLIQGDTNVIVPAFGDTWAPIRRSRALAPSGVGLVKETLSSLEITRAFLVGLGFPL